jgi:cytochrome b-561
MHTQTQTTYPRETREERKKGWLEERLGLEGLRKKYLRKAFPVHPTFFLGEIALFSFIVVVITGIYLSFSYEPSARIISVEGQSAPAAYHSVLQIDKQSFGLIVRQVHHWSAHLMIAAVVLHLLRVFFTGAYRRPREINWLLGCLLLILTVFAAFSGYLLPYDEFSVTATGIGYGIVASIPWVGQALAEFFFGGKFPALGTVPRFYGYHVMLLPLLLLGLIALHFVIMLKQKHTEPHWNRGKVAPGQLLGIPLWPQQAALMAVLFLFMTGGVLLLSSMFPVHPVEVYGPPGPQTPPVKPDWYFLWVYGLLKLIPGWMEFRLWGGTINPEVIGGVLLPGLIVLLIFIFPFFERVRESQHYLETPSERPARTALGVAALALLVVLSAAGYEDELELPLNTFRWAALIAPVASGAITHAVLAQVKRLRPQTRYRT